MVLRLKTRESRSLPGLLKARNKPKSSSRHHSGPAEQQAALKRPFCFGTIPENKHAQSPKCQGTQAMRPLQETNGLPHPSDGAAPPNRKRQSLRGPANKRIRAAKVAQSNNAGWSSPVARQAHNLKAAGSNPAPATKIKARWLTPAGFLCFWVQPGPR